MEGGGAGIPLSALNWHFLYDRMIAANHSVYLKAIEM